MLVGTGGNGGGALVHARRLHIWGAQMQVYVAKPASAFTPVPTYHLAILQQMRIPIAQAEDVLQASRPDLIIDGLIGYGLKDAPRGAAAGLIRWANTLGAPILALDVPSGIDTATGTVFDPAIRATATMTLALPKEGLHSRDVGGQVGELYLADISVPPSLYSGLELALQVGHLFAKSEIIRLR